MKAANVLETIGNTPHIRINRLFGDRAEVWMVTKGRVMRCEFALLCGRNPHKTSLHCSGGGYTADQRVAKAQHRPPVRGRCASVAFTSP